MPGHRREATRVTLALHEVPSHGRRKASDNHVGGSFDLAYRKLRELIVHGRLAPGTRVIEADIAERLQVSRTPVRSALHRLQQEGYVIYAGRGRQSRLSVSPLTKEDARELYLIIAHLEGLASRLAAELNPTTRSRVVQRLRAINAELDSLATDGNGKPGQIFDLDMAFHQVLVECAAGPRTLSIHAAIKPQTERYWRLYASAIVDELGNSVAEHNRILESIERGDPDATQQAVEINWRNGTERLASVIDRLGERGHW